MNLDPDLRRENGAESQALPCKANPLKRLEVIDELWAERFAEPWNMTIADLAYSFERYSFL
jgi:hypothetical protein